MARTSKRVTTTPVMKPSRKRPSTVMAGARCASRRQVFLNRLRSRHPRPARRVITVQMRAPHGQMWARAPLLCMGCVSTVNAAFHLVHRGPSLHSPSIFDLGGITQKTVEGNTNTNGDCTVGEHRLSFTFHLLNLFNRGQANVEWLLMTRELPWCSGGAGRRTS
jgi:hypothetical protein